MRALVLPVVFIAALGSPVVAADPADGAPGVSVRDAGGTYVVSAGFTVPAAAAVVRAVLTDYEQIPRFMPGVRMSRVLERGDGYTRIEQEAVSKFMLFSKRIHVVLDVSEGPDEIRFRDLCGRSFSAYHGAWTIRELSDRTEIDYELTARPGFDVPGFVLRRLLERDARAMIDGLRAEIGARAR